MTNDEFKQALQDEYGGEGEDALLFADGFEDALIGVTHTWGRDGQTQVALYDYEKCAEILMARDKCSREDAEEFLTFNTLGAYVGARTPAYAMIHRRVR